MSDLLNSIIWHPIPDDQFVNKVFDKHQIYVHHTASSRDPYGVVDWWRKTEEAVSTAFVIAGKEGKRKDGKAWNDGDIVQCFSSKKGGWHLGLKQSHLNAGKPGNKTSTWLNMHTIGIEICNWGQLTKTSNGFKTYAGTIVKDEDVVEYSDKFRGYQFYERYTDAQLENTRQLLRYLCDVYEIDPKFKGMEIFDIDKRALRGENGIWTHVSVRPDKFDCHPQPELVQMLQSL